MKRELVKSLRTVCLLAMFSQDSSTVSNIQSALKSMSVLEPDLILHPILERAVPALEALIEVSRSLICHIAYVDVPSDTTYHRRDQSVGSSRACVGVQGCVLSWREALVANSRASASGN